MTLQQVYRCAIDPELFAAKIEQAEAWSDELNKGTVFVPEDVLKAELIKLAEWAWKDAPDTDEQQAVYSHPPARQAGQTQAHLPGGVGARTRRRGKGAGGGGQALVRQ